jgi:hypothetical protein
VPGLPMRRMFSRWSMYSQRVSSATSRLLTDGASGEVEAFQRLDGREAGGLEAAFGGALLTLEEFEFAELEQVGEVVVVVGRRLDGDLLGFGADRWEPKRFEVVMQEHERFGLEGLHGHAP